jgi:DNA (cytosine-5)-methyltransferase 1
LGIKKLKSLELFAGAGGLSLGLHQAGFQHIALVEWNARAVKTLKINCEQLLNLNPELVFEEDVREFPLSSLEQNIDLIAGGPPCQPFSTSGKSLAHLDQRDMFPSFLNAIRVLRPKSILIENVKGLLRDRFKEYFEYIILRIQYPFAVNGENNFSDELRKLRRLKANSFQAQETYQVTYQLIDTADFGVPQRRERVFISAFRSDLGISPRHIQPSHSKESLLHDQFITGEYWTRHNIPVDNFLGARDLRIVNTLNKIGGLEPGEAEKQRKPWRTVRDAIHSLPEPVLRGNKEEVPNHVQHPGARIYKGHVGSYHDLPSKTLRAGTHGTPGGENMVRINNTDAVRYFTTREAARLHTFPDVWRFNGETWGSAISQLGNAVPVRIGELFGEYLSNTLKNT